MDPQFELFCVFCLCMACYLCSMQRLSDWRGSCGHTSHTMYAHVHLAAAPACMCESWANVDMIGSRRVPLTSANMHADPNTHRQDIAMI